LAALDKYSQDHPELKLGWIDWKNLISRKENIFRIFPSVARIGIQYAKTGFWHTKLCAKPLKGVKILFLVLWF
jgi:hypothetical protein